MADAIDKATLNTHPLWVELKSAVNVVRPLQVHDGSIPDVSVHPEAALAVERIAEALERFTALLPHDQAYLQVCAADFRRWAESGFAVPDFFDSLVHFDPAGNRVNGTIHLVVFPMYTQNGSPDRLVEAVLCQVLWPDFVAELEAGDYSNELFVPVTFIDFTDGYATNSAVLFPETIAMAAVPPFTWGAIFADREAKRFRTVTEAAAEITRLQLPKRARRLLSDERFAQETFVMWDLIHDRTHMRGDLPFDPFMIKQRMPYFLYALEEMRCDLTAFRAAVQLEQGLNAKPKLTKRGRKLLKYSKSVQPAILFDRIFRFPLTGNRERNYDGLGGQLLFAYLHQRDVLRWTDVQLTIDWERLPAVVVELADRIDALYWASIDRPKQVHWLAAYDLIAESLAPHPASRWAKRDFPLDGSAREYTDAVLDDEFPLSMFYEALSKKLRPIIDTATIDPANGAPARS
jgi:hypothetical protein